LTGVKVRTYRNEDEPAILALLRSSLGRGPAGERTTDFFRWKHLRNPFGRSFMLVGEADGRVVGLRAFMRWEFRAADRTLLAVRAVDTATDPGYRGRGIFRELTLRAVDALRGEVDLIFNTPNSQSRPGYLKMGWRKVATVPVSVLARRPFRVLRAAGTLRSAVDSGSPVGGPPSVDAAPASGALDPSETLKSFLSEVSPADPRIHTSLSLQYLRWRYASVSRLDYRVISLEEEGRLLGLGVFRVRPRGPLWQTSVAEIIVRPGDRRSAVRLLRLIRRAAPTDYLASSFPRGSTLAQASRRTGFLPSPGGLSLVVNPLRPDLEPDPTELRSWALSLGDLEVF
jgi:GNAT superfamily N-acetyltransferase